MDLKLDNKGNEYCFLFSCIIFIGSSFIHISCLMACYFAVYFGDYKTQVGCIVSIVHHPPLQSSAVEYS
jgi:hypothetical protein